MKLFFKALAALVFTLSAQAGGISAGGGGTITPDSAGTNFIQLQLSGARTNLIFLLKGISFSNEYTELFDAKENIIDKVRKYSLKIETDKACYDLEGHAVDASIQSDNDTICFSAMAIGQKVSKLDDYPQLLALMAHEYSHLMGFDEKEASRFQTKILYLAKSVDSLDGHNMGVGFLNEYFHLQVALTGMEDTGDKDLKKAYNFLRNRNANLNSHDKIFTPLSSAEAKKMAEVLARVESLENYLCAAVETDPGLKADCSRNYRYEFNDNTVDVADLGLVPYRNKIYAPSGRKTNLAKWPQAYLDEVKLTKRTLNELIELLNADLNLVD